MSGTRIFFFLNGKNIFFFINVILIKNRVHIHDFLQNGKRTKYYHFYSQKIHCAWPKKGFFFFSKKIEKIFFSFINVGLLSKKRGRIHDF